VAICDLSRVGPLLVVVSFTFIKKKNIVTPFGPLSTTPHSCTAYAKCRGMAINPGDGKEASTEFFLKYVGELSIIILLRKKRLFTMQVTCSSLYFFLKKSRSTIISYKEKREFKS